MPAFCLRNLSIGFQGPFRRLCLCRAKSRFPRAEICLGGDLVRMLGQWDGKPSISRCLDHSAGKSVTGNAHAAWKPTIDGGFDEIGCEESERDRHVDLPATTSLTLCDAVVSDASFVSSLSHRRPRAMAATSVARVWERIGKELPIRSPRRRGQATTEVLRARAR